MYELGGNVLGFSEAQSSSAAKGESVVRHDKDSRSLCGHHRDEAPEGGRTDGRFDARSTVPVINAGDGGHNHPTQTLTDLLTIKQGKGQARAT